jgi:hypothetical protein
VVWTAFLRVYVVKPSMPWVSSQQIVPLFLGKEVSRIKISAGQASLFLSCTRSPGFWLEISIKLYLEIFPLDIFEFSFVVLSLEVREGSATYSGLELVVGFPLDS